MKHALKTETGLSLNNLSDFVVLPLSYQNCTTVRKSTKLEVEFHRVPYNQTFDLVTGQFVKILSFDRL